MLSAPVLDASQNARKVNLLCCQSASSRGLINARGKPGLLDRFRLFLATKP